MHGFVSTVPLVGGLPFLFRKYVAKKSPQSRAEPSRVDPYLLDVRHDPECGLLCPIAKNQ